MLLTASPPTVELNGGGAIGGEGGATGGACGEGGFSGGDGGGGANGGAGGCIGDLNVALFGSRQTQGYVSEQIAALGALLCAYPVRYLKQPCGY